MFRRFILLLGALVIVAVLVFTSPTAAVAQVAQSDQLIIYSWWTAGEEREALEALFDLYKQEYPDVRIVDNPVLGGSGVETKSVMKALILAGNPPTTFQVHPGGELGFTYVQNNLIAPLTDLWVQEGWSEVYPEAIQELVQFNDDFYAVPVNIHRANLVWYNKRIFDQLDLSPPETIDEFFTVMDRLQEAGIIPLSMASRSKWPAAHAFEVVLLGVGGPEFYLDYFKGEASALDPKFIIALETFRRMLRFINPDHAMLTSGQAASLVRQGKTAMIIMGDWIKGHFDATDWVAGIDYDMFPFPGTDRVFDLVTDAFAMPKGAPGWELGLEWLKLLGSIEGQVAFNRIKGSIPARTDVPLDPFDVIAQRNIEDLRMTTLVPSAVHGSAAPDAFMSDWNDVIIIFLYNQDIDLIVRQLESIAKDHGLR